MADGIPGRSGTLRERKKLSTTIGASNHTLPAQYGKGGQGRESDEGHPHGWVYGPFDSQQSHVRLLFIADFNRAYNDAPKPIQQAFDKQCKRQARVNRGGGSIFESR